MQKINSTPGRLTSMHHNLAKQLIHGHITTSRHERLPEYNFDNLEKGIVCELCRGFMLTIRSANMRCTDCGHEERTEAAVMRTVFEFHILFPAKRITTFYIYEWCKVINSKYRIRKILMENMQLIQNGKYSYYIF